MIKLNIFPRLICRGTSFTILVSTMLLFFRMDWIYGWKDGHLAAK
jgi:hypothetical protein